MSGLQKRRGAGASDADPLDNKALHHADLIYQQPVGEASVTAFPQRRLSLRRLASVRLGELYRLACFRRHHRLAVDANTFAFVLAATLACGGRGNMLIRGRVNREAGMEARPRVIPWAGLDLASLREGVTRADLGEIGDAELRTVIEAVRRWQTQNGAALISAARLGEMLALTSVERAECRIKTIDALDEPKAERRARQREEKRMRDREGKRVTRGRMPREIYEAKALSRSMPWEAEGVSRRTWERRRAKAVASVSLHDIEPIRSATHLRHEALPVAVLPVAGPARQDGDRRGACAGGPTPGAQPIAGAPRRTRRATASGKQAAGDGDHDGGGGAAGILAAVRAARALVRPEEPMAATLGLCDALLEATGEASPAELGTTARIVAADLARLLRPLASNDNRLVQIMRRLAA